MELTRRGSSTTAILLLLTLGAACLLGPVGARRGRRGGRSGRDRGSVTEPPSPVTGQVLLPPGGSDNVTLSAPVPTPPGNASTADAADADGGQMPQQPQQPEQQQQHQQQQQQQQQKQNKHKLLEAQRLSDPSLQSQVHHTRSDVQIGCKELRSKRYISDGFCTSIKPVTEVVCTGHCLPMTNLPWYAEFIKVWARTKVLEWRCVNDVVKRRRVRLLCENGETRTYRIKVVKSCKCKRYMKQQNQSLASKGRTNGSHHHRRKEKEAYKKSRAANRAPPSS